MKDIYENLLLVIRSMKNRFNKNGLLIFTSGTTDYTLRTTTIGGCCLKQGSPI